MKTRTQFRGVCGVNVSCSFGRDKVHLMRRALPKSLTHRVKLHTIKSNECRLIKKPAAKRPMAPRCLSCLNRREIHWHALSFYLSIQYLTERGKKERETRDGSPADTRTISLMKTQPTADVINIYTPMIRDYITGSSLGHSSAMWLHFGSIRDLQWIRWPTPGHTKQLLY